jgi:glycine cleavage system aminomethyltransferase T
MSFEFLAPGQAAAPAGGGPVPALRSPIELEHLDAGAKLREREGWNIVADYGEPDRETEACRATVGVADLSCLGKFELQADRETVASIVSALAGGATLEPGMAAGHDSVWWCPVTPQRVVAITAPERTAEVAAALEDRAGEARFASVTELTAALGSNSIIGPMARETFARATALDMRPESFPERAFAPVSVARTPGMVLREEGDRFLHLFGAGYAQYNWTVFVDAAQSLGGRAVGMDALKAAVTEGTAAGA